MQPIVNYLTFDDGPIKGTGEVLDVLKDAGVSATFFLTGTNATAAGGLEQQKALFRRMRAEGHAVGNHGYVHSPMSRKQYKDTYGDLSTLQQRDAFAENYAANEAYFRKLADDPSFRFTVARLPGDGRAIKHLVKQTETLGLKHVGWDYEFAPNGTFEWVNNADWQGIKGVSCTYEDLPADRNVILLHDRHWHGNGDLLRQVIGRLQDNHRVFAKLA